MSIGNGEASDAGRTRFEPQQVEVLKRVFRDCPNPDEGRRINLSRELGLTPQQIMIWFRNQRNSVKLKNGKLSNCSLRSENDKMRCEITELQMALGNCLCSVCGIALSSQDEEEQWLQLINECVKAEIDECMRIITDSLGRPFAEMSLMQCSLDPASTAANTNRCNDQSSVVVLSNNSSMNVPLRLHPFNTAISNRDKALVIKEASNAMTELTLPGQSTAGLWFKPVFEDKEAKWADLFQTIVSKAKMIEVLSVGIGVNNHSGSLLLMHSEIGIPSPLIPSREYCFVRYCQKLENGLWCIADASVHLPGYDPKNRMLPSGCLIQEMPNGYSQVTWVEHLEVEATNLNLGVLVLQNKIESGIAFGAQRWLTTLQRMSERSHYLLAPHDMDMGGVITTVESKISMMSLSSSMVKSFCNSLFPANEIQERNTLLNVSDIQIRVLPQNKVGGLNGIILNAITSMWLPFSTERVFSVFKDEQKRNLWDILANGNIVQPISNLYTGSNNGNRISLLQFATSDPLSMMLLQETRTDPSISMLVYARVDNPVMEIVLNGGDTSHISLIPSGVVVIPNFSSSISMRPSSSSNPAVSGSFMTLSFQFVLSNQSSTNQKLEMLKSVKGMLLDAVKNVKNALNFP